MTLSNRLCTLDGGSSHAQRRFGRAREALGHLHAIRNVPTRALRVISRSWLAVAFIATMGVLAPVRAGATIPSASHVYGDGSRVAADSAGGYWTTTAAGRVRPYEGAGNYGSMPRGKTSGPIVGIAATPDGGGYWLVASDGGVFAFGDAGFDGSAAEMKPRRHYVGVTPSPDGGGYWLVASNGDVINFGDAVFYGSLAGSRAHVQGVVVDPTIPGYTLVESDGSSVAFGSNESTSAPGDPPSSTATMTPPSDIADNCSSDVTNALNSWFASVPANSTIDLPANACYSVSNTSTFLTFSSLSDLTINGNNTTFRQSTYENGQCNKNKVQPILQLRSNNNLTFNQITLDGPGNGCGGGDNEGDYGLELGQATPGNTNITFNDVIVENTDGDGMAILPQLGTCCGINTNITFENGAMSNIGYHSFTPEGVNGLNILNNTFAHDGNFMDMEVDNNCPYTGPTSGCGNTTMPTGTAQWNITISGNTFSDDSGLGIDSLQGICIPQKNLVIEDNVLDATSRGLSMQLGGSGSSSCPQDSGLTIEGNVSAGPAKSPCGGSIVGGPACSMIEIADYANVDITNNQFTAYDGSDDYFPNTIFVPCITFQGVATATVTGNTCNNAYDIWDDDSAQFPSTAFTNSGINACSNTWGLTQPIAPVGEAAPATAPQLDSRCPT